MQKNVGCYTAFMHTIIDLQTKTTQDLCTRHLEEQVDGQVEFQIAQSIMLASININPAIVYKVIVLA